MQNKGKLIIVIVCLVAAGVLLAMNMGLLGGSGRPAPAAKSASGDSKAPSGTAAQTEGETKPVTTLQRDKF